MEENNTTPTVEELMEKMKKFEEDRKKFEADSQRWVQKLINENKEVKKEKEFLENVNKWAKTIRNNPEYLLELKLKNPDVADKILKDYFDWMDISEYKKEYEIEGDYQDVEFLANKIAQKKVNEIVTKNIKDTYLDWYDENTKTLFEERFSEITKGNNITKDNIKKYLEYAKQLSWITTNENWDNNNWNDWNNWMSDDEIKKKIAEQAWYGWGNWWDSWWENKNKNSKEKNIQDFWKNI